VVDPLTLEVLRHGLAGIAEEMGTTLRRTAHSPNITEREDCSCALMAASGELCAQAEHIPVHLGSMPASAAALLARFPALAEGDVALVNDPFSGGTHLNDLTMLSPVFDRGEGGGRLLGYVATRAHHADVGGKAPGSMPGDSTDIFQEGLRLPPVLAWRGGVADDAVLGIIVANSRSPRERLGDLRAQAGAHEVGANRLRALAARMGPDGLAAAMEGLMAYSERRVRAGIAALPDGAWSFEDFLDSDGVSDRPVRIAVTVAIEGDQMVVDFTGSDPQVPGNCNAPLAVTTSAVAFAVRALTGPDVPPTAGGMRPVTVIAPVGSVVNAQAPAAVSAGNVETSQRILDAVLGALAQAIPGSVPAASQGTMNNLLVGTGSFAYYETTGGGQGARPGPRGRDGMDGVHTGMTNTKNTPAEALEYAFPLRVRRCELRDATGGDGTWRGGMGIRRDVEILSAVATVSLQTDRRSRGPWGLAGGGPGASGRNVLIRGGREVELPDKCTFEARRGDVVSVQTPGGGGWGPPPAVLVRQELAATQG
jgi:N-methylhydantoinase B